MPLDLPALELSLVELEGRSERAVRVMTVLTDDVKAFVTLLEQAIEEQKTNTDNRSSVLDLRDRAMSIYAIWR